MSSTTVILLVIAIVALAVAGWAFLQRQKTLRLRGKYGPEYDRLAAEQRSVRGAENILESREKRVSKFRIRPLGEEDRARLAAEWRAVQEHFVDDPRGAVSQADRLINEALRARGYPMSQFEQQAADLSVQYPHVVQNYRQAHKIAIEDQSRAASTEELRQAMQHYRTLFEDVLETKITNQEHVEARHG
jgi:FtsZ-interacting cell division protein ZipA